MQTKMLLLVLGVSFVFGGWQYLKVERLNATLKSERAEHSALLTQTRAERDAAFESGQGWIDAYDALVLSIDSQKANAQACFEREREAAHDSAARTDILSRALARPRTENETQQVVDNETRRAAAMRLNRVW